MMLHDPELARIIKQHQPVEILGKQYYIEPAHNGSCDGCVFINTGKCPQRAVTYCTSNGGNILIEIDNTDGQKET